MAKPQGKKIGQRAHEGVASHGEAGAGRTLKNSAKIRRWRFWASPLICILVVSLEFMSEHAQEFAENASAPKWLTERVERVGAILESPSTYVPRPVEARYVALVSINGEAERSLRGPCMVRAFLTKLFPALAAQRPAMIVSDIALAGDNNSDACQPNTAETQALEKALEDASRVTPLVLGQASLRLEELSEDSAKQLQAEGFRADDLLLRAPIGLISTTNISFGLIRLNQQVKRVPINWFVHQDEFAGAVAYPSLALAAAEKYRSNFPKGNLRLQPLEDARYHPIAELLPENSFAVVPAIRLICGNRDTGEWQHCEGVSPDKSSIEPQLQGRIVVVGFSDRSEDIQKTNVGQVAGYVLQANYIEALLDARTYRTLDFVTTSLISTLWFVLLLLPSRIFKPSIMSSFIFPASVSLIILFLAKYVAIVNFGLYISLLAPGILIFAILPLELLAKVFEEKEV